MVGPACLPSKCHTVCYIMELIGEITLVEPRGPVAYVLHQGNEPHLGDANNDGTRK